MDVYVISQQLLYSPNQNVSLVPEHQSLHCDTEKPISRLFWLIMNSTPIWELHWNLWYPPTIRHNRFIRIRFLNHRCDYPKPEPCNLHQFVYSSLLLCCSISIASDYSVFLTDVLVHAGIMGSIKYFFPKTISDENLMHGMSAERKPERFPELKK